ncbi:MAG: hypothetical protein JXO72_11790 [Vicinamibacteria bacterium]|nr:hypothetical protein [Vicinamibacteria bacterium]
MPRKSGQAPRQLTLPFEAGPWNAGALESMLSLECGRPVEIVFTENRSVLLSFRKTGKMIRLRLHRIFLHAPIDVLRALARSVRRRGLHDGVVRRFMNENLHHVRKSTRKLPPLKTAGRFHDLRQIRDRLRDRFFGGGLKVPITWGRGIGSGRRGRLTFGSYDPVLGIIRIHPVLDRQDVPLYFIESVVYHELLHHLLGGVVDAAGRTIYHSKAFRSAEERFPWQRQALAWEKANLPRLLRAAARLDAVRRIQAAWSRRPARRSRRAKPRVAQCRSRDTNCH